MTDRIVLIGLSGGGKSTVGSLLSDKLGWTLCDTDAEIERHTGRSVPEIFAESGEAAFRKIERQVFQDALSSGETVIATGGGAVVNEDIWAAQWLGDPMCLTIWLDAPAEVLVERLQGQLRDGKLGAARPLLAGDDPMRRFESMRREREPYYRRADVTIPVTGQGAGSIAHRISKIVHPWQSWRVDLDVPGGTSRIQVGHGIRSQLPEVVSARWPGAKTIWVVADEQVAAHHMEQTLVDLAGTGARVRSTTFPPGEGSKSIDGLSRLYDALLGGGIERSDCIVASGGGVTGDLVGFVAASVLRGVGLIQVPTNVLSMVDSSVGGKTGINHATGKNLIGAFYQPSEVMIDPDFLETLPDRQYRNGWAEIIKHGLIEPSAPAGDSGLLELIRANADSLVERRSPLLASIIARNVEIKASVVRADEREDGLRAILNFGHTIGHAVEASGYRLLHGEAVAVGLHGVMRLGVELGRIGVEDADAVEDVLSRFGLPVAADARLDDVRRYMTHDKKRRSGEQQWVLPKQGGGVAIERGIPGKSVDLALQRVLLESPA